MHPVILGGGLLLASAMGCAVAAPVAARAGAACPGPQAPLTERFIAADCTACWAAEGAQAGASRTAGGGWTLDWLLPRGTEAAMSAAALPDATDRLQRSGLREPTDQTLQNRPALPRRTGLKLQVSSGPAWQGYFGVQLRLTLNRPAHQPAGPPAHQPASLPAGSTAWLALVEQIPAGAEGSALPRQLVRSVAGPLPLDALRAGRPFTHLQALRWPEGAQPERLRAHGWLEAPDGRVLAMAAERCD